jgi:hypothetical protein
MPFTDDNAGKQRLFWRRPGPETLPRLITVRPDTLAGDGP